MAITSDIQFITHPLILDNNHNISEILSFTQIKSGDINVASPYFSELEFIRRTKERKIIVSNIPEGGHLALGVSGGNKVSEELVDIVINCESLVDKDNKPLESSHIFTIQLAEPKFMPYFNKPDPNQQAIIKMPQLSPIAIAFFAMPKTKIVTVDVSATFRGVEATEVSVPSDIDSGCFDLLYNTIGWWAYRTQHIDNWATHSSIYYDDDLNIPVLVGKESGHSRADFCMPKYELENGHLHIGF